MNMETTGVMCAHIQATWQIMAKRMEGTPNQIIHKGALVPIVRD